MITKRYDKDTGKMHVTFSFPAAIWATRAALVGDFNNWDSAATPLHLYNRRWSTTLELDAGRTYRYRYLVDERWYNDWQADGYVANDIGGDDSVVETSVPNTRHLPAYTLSTPSYQASPLV